MMISELKYSITKNDKVFPKIKKAYILKLFMGPKNVGKKYS